MPGGDGTGPSGMGPMTGRGAGFCDGAERAGVALSPGGFGGRGRGRGLGRGRGFGRGMCRGLGWVGMLAAGGLLAHHLFGATSQDDEKAMLTKQATAMERALTNIKQRLSELERGA